MADEDTNPPWPFGQGPFLSAAILCEKVLIEQDGVASAIRIVDRVTQQVSSPQPPDPMEPFEHELTLYLTFKSGAARGPINLEIRLQKPSGESPAPMFQTLNFEGDDERGVNVINKFQIRIEMPGLYWFDVYLEGHRITRIPLRVIYLPQVTQTYGISG